MSDTIPNPEPCDLGCTVECDECGGEGQTLSGGDDHDCRDCEDGCFIICPECDGTGTLPAVHASEDECRPPLPEGWDIELSELLGDFVCYIGVRDEDGAWDFLWCSLYFHHEADRDAAISEACRRIARQHKEDAS